MGSRRIKRSKELLGVRVNRIEEKVLGTWANREEKLERVNSNLTLKQKFAKNEKNRINIKNTRFVSDYII